MPSEPRVIFNGMDEYATVQKMLDEGYSHSQIEEMGLGSFLKKIAKKFGVGGKDKNELPSGDDWVAEQEKKKAREDFDRRAEEAKKAQEANNAPGTTKGNSKFDETQHPRDETGKFTKAPTTTTTRPKPKPTTTTTAPPAPTTTTTLPAPTTTTTRPAPTTTTTSKPSYTETTLFQSEYKPTNPNDFTQQTRRSKVTSKSGKVRVSYEMTQQPRTVTSADDFPGEFRIVASSGLNRWRDPVRVRPGTPYKSSAVVSVTPNKEYEFSTLYENNSYWKAVVTDVDPSTPENAGGGNFSSNFQEETEIG